MKFYTPAILLLSGLLIISSSCTKDKPAVDEFPKTLQYTGITYTGTIRVFTYQGEITNPAVIAKAIVSTGLDQISHPAGAKVDPITFVSKNELQINSDHYSLTDATGDRLLFASDNPATITDDNFAVKFAPLYAYPSLEIKGDNFIYRHPLILHGNYSSVKLSGMDFCVVQHNETSGVLVRRYTSAITNEFEIRGITSLGLRDTLAIREYVSNFEVKK